MCTSSHLMLLFVERLHHLLDASTSVSSTVEVWLGEALQPEFSFVNICQWMCLTHNASISASVALLHCAQCIPTLDISLALACRWVNCQVGHCI